MNNRQWMIYGANGYTGELIAREAVERGSEPVLAGRSAGKIEPLAADQVLEVAFQFRFGVACVVHLASLRVCSAGSAVVHLVPVDGHVGHLAIVT